ncbi:MAG: AAA family ATPase [Nitrospirota bacterium]|nr:AAA family ATPase [Nitrospirota bacterium]
MSEASVAWVQGLQNPESYPHPVDQIKLLETHISWILLTGCYAYKIKKPVKFSFVDFSTLERRRWFCEEEVRLNRRLAPEVYLGIVPITGSPSHPRMHGSGPPFEFAVKMKQFSSASEIHGILNSKERAEPFIQELAEIIAQFHAQIEQAGEEVPYGNPDMVWRPVGECLDEMPLELLTQTVREHLNLIERGLLEEWRNVSVIFRQRKQSGYVRECHGDLHLGNIAIFEGNVCVFDALEFEPRLRWIDVMSEVAFLVMDLEKHGRQDLAYLFLNRYLELTGDYEGLKVLKFYKVYRALVRAKVAGLRLAQLAERGMEEEKAKGELTGYVELAHRFMACVSPALILMHGVSGTGKTTVSTEIVKAVGAIRVRSDVERKRLFAETVKSKTPVPQDVGLYHSDMTARTYAQLRDLARTLLQEGFLVIIDATFLQQSQREVFRDLAKAEECEWLIVDVSAPQAVLAERIELRSREGRDASDATVEIMKQQQETDEPFTQEEKPNVINVDSTDPQSILSALEDIKKNAGF